MGAKYLSVVDPERARKLAAERLRMEERRERKRALGICECSRPLDIEDRRLCSRCLERFAERSRRTRVVRKVTINKRGITKRELELGALLYPKSDIYKRPKTRGDCAKVPRPCPFVGCKYNLYLDVTPKGNITLNFPDLEPHEMGYSCALDVAAKGGQSHDQLAIQLNLTRERARQLENLIVRKLAQAGALFDLATERSDSDTNEGQRERTSPLVNDRHLRILHDDLASAFEGDITDLFPRIPQQQESFTSGDQATSSFY